MTLWQPLEWFLEVMQLVLAVEFFPGLSLGTITLGLLAIVLIFRMVIFPLTGGSIGSAIQGAYDNSSFKKNRDQEKAYQRYKEQRFTRNYHETRFNRELGIKDKRSKK